MLLGAQSGWLLMLHCMLNSKLCQPPYFFELAVHNSFGKVIIYHTMTQTNYIG